MAEAVQLVVALGRKILHPKREILITLKLVAHRGSPQNKECSGNVPRSVNKARNSRYSRPVNVHCILPEKLSYITSAASERGRVAADWR
jgi:hypothetical protein